MLLPTTAAALLLSIVSATPVRRQVKQIPLDTCSPLDPGLPSYDPLPGSCTKSYYCGTHGCVTYECTYPQVFFPSTRCCTTLPPDVQCVKGQFAYLDSTLQKRINLSVASSVVRRVDVVTPTGNIEPPKDNVAATEDGVPVVLRKDAITAIVDSTS